MSTPNTKSNEEILKELYKQLTNLGIRWVDADDNTSWNIENNIDACELLAEALTLKDQAHKAEVEEAAMAAYREAGNFVGELYETGNMGDNEYSLLVEFFDEKLNTTTPLPESDKQN